MGYSADLSRLLFFLTLVLTSPLHADEKQPAPDTSRIVALVNGSMAHACPIGPEYALTARHVVLHETVFGSKPVAYRGSNVEWASYLEHDFASDFEDAGMLKASRTPFPSWYRMATQAPQPGDRLWWVGFDWRKPSVAFAERVFSGKVLRIVAGIVIVDEPTPSGSSGSCVLNAAGEVVGIVSFRMETDNGQEVAGIVGLWAPWFRPPSTTAPPVPSAKTPEPTPQP